MQLCTASEVMALDRYAIEQVGIPGAVLMENAGRFCSRWFADRFATHFPGPVLVVAGKGNNGGDGYVMARILSESGWQVTTLILGEKEAISGDARVMLNIITQLGVPIRYIEDTAALQSRLC